VGCACQSPSCRRLARDLVNSLLARLRDSSRLAGSKSSRSLSDTRES
jgi:hypothetical protein